MAQAIYEAICEKLPAIEDATGLANFAAGQMGPAGSQCRHMLTAVDWVAEENVGQHRSPGDQASHFRRLAKKPGDWWRQRERNAAQSEPGPRVPRKPEVPSWQKQGPAMSAAEFGTQAKALVDALRGGGRGGGPTKFGELVSPAEPGNGRSVMTLEEAAEAAREAQRKAEELRVDQSKRCDSCGAVGHTAAQHELFERELAEAQAAEEASA